MLYEYDYVFIYYNDLRDLLFIHRNIHEYTCEWFSGCKAMVGVIILK